ncbi:hypothetical protein LUZ60_016431 [Juncus effusus]|nr:hypothetical protein LUZ60_016431 [Juncus effusus]
MAENTKVWSGLEWRVTVSDGSSVKINHENGLAMRIYTWFISFLIMVKDKFVNFMKKAWNLGVEDPRRVLHGLKVGLALSLVSLFYYTRPLYDGVGGAAMWAVMTVVVVFEYTVGGCLYKGFNRATATLVAGSIALGVHWVASKSGDKLEPVILSTSVFIVASVATFSRFIPIVKTRFDYGITIFILTYSLVAVSGYRVEALFALAQQRVSTIAIGIFICLCVCLLIRPVWAGKELHLLIVRNMEKLATSLEGCMEEYFDAEENSDKKNFSQKSQGYKAVLNAKASEESQANLARWEPAHGRFGFRHPWTQYLKVGVSMRYTAYCIEALSGSIHSEIQAMHSVKKNLSDDCKRLSTQCSMVLKELSNSIKEMQISRSIDLLVSDMNNAVRDLQDALRLLPNRLQITQGEEQDKKNNITNAMSLMEALPLITFCSLLIEISVRIETVVDSVDTLANLSGFKPVKDEKPEKVNPLDSDEEGNENMKVIQEV